MALALVGSALLAGLPGVSAAHAANVALSSEGAVAIADSEYSYNFANVAIDGKWLGPGDPSESNRWHSSLSKPHPHWVWIRFRLPAVISKVVIHRADIVGHPVDFVGEYSPDGGLTFRTLFRITGNRMTDDVWSVERSFPPVIADNFRLTINRSSYERFPNSAQLSEIEVFGDFVSPASKTSGPIRAEALPAPKLKPSKTSGLTITETADEIEFRSKWLRLAVSKSDPRITALCWDSLGEGKVEVNLLKPGADGGARLTRMPLFPAPESRGETRMTRDGNVVRYETPNPDGGRSRWEILVGEKAVRMAITTALPEPRVTRSPQGLTMAFACDKTPVAPLANPTKSDAAPLPCLLHAPDFGTVLVEGSDKGVGCIISESVRPQARWNASVVGASRRRNDGLYVVPAGASSLELRLSVRSDTIPAAKLLGKEARLRAMPRHWLNGFQYRPDFGILSNNIVSDNCCFCMHQYADLAVFSPDLPGGIRPIEMVRESLDRYFAGASGYGVGWKDIMTDAYPSYLISAWDVIRVTGDVKLLRRWLPKLEEFGSAIEQQDRNGNGLPESVKPGVRGEIHCPTGNWWDQINFGHEDAYVSALAYRAFNCLADLERLAGRSAEADRFERDAERIKAAYLPTFLNPKTGVIAGWKDVDGNLHDYWFVFINGIAIAYGLVPDDEASRIVDNIEAKMKEVGFSRFDLGLPGPLVPIPKNDYGIGALGSPRKDDGSDAFQVFENGGASACMAYFYVQALYRLGRRPEADRILWPMMKTYADGGFQNGVGAGGEWRRWDGRPSGYEGYLADAYYTQLALLNGYYGIGFGPDGFRLEKWSTLKGKPVPLGLRYMGRMVDEIR